MMTDALMILLLLALMLTYIVDWFKLGKDISAKVKATGEPNYDTVKHNRPGPFYRSKHKTKLWLSSLLSYDRTHNWEVRDDREPDNTITIVEEKAVTLAKVDSITGELVVDKEATAKVASQERYRRAVVGG